MRMLGVPLPWWLLIPLGVGLSSLFPLMVYLYPANPPIWALLVAATAMISGVIVVLGGIGSIGHRAIRIPLIPWFPDGERRLTKRLERVGAMQHEIQIVLARMPQDNVHRPILEGRKEELAALRDAIQIEMTYGKLRDLDRKAGRVVRDELKRQGVGGG